MITINGTQITVYAKAVASFAVGLLTILAVIISVASDGKIDTNDWMAIITSVIGVLAGTSAVYQVKNTKQQGE